MARTDRRRTRIGVDVEVRSSGRSKGGGQQLVPVLTVEEERRKKDDRGGGKKNERRVRAERLLETSLEEVTALARRRAVGDRVTVVGPGPRLVVLSPRGVLGLASLAASEAMTAALRTAPGARLECVVSSAGERGVSVDVSLIRPATGDEGRLERRDAGPVVEPEVDDLAAVAAQGRGGR